MRPTSYLAQSGVAAHEVLAFSAAFRFDFSQPGYNYVRSPVSDHTITLNVDRPGNFFRCSPPKEPTERDRRRFAAKQLFTAARTPRRLARSRSVLSLQYVSERRTNRRGLVRPTPTTLLSLNLLVAPSHKLLSPLARSLAQFFLGGSVG